MTTYMNYVQTITSTYCVIPPKRDREFKIMYGDRWEGLHSVRRRLLGVDTVLISWWC